MNFILRWWCHFLTVQGHENTLLYSVHFTLFICYPVLAEGPVL